MFVTTYINVDNPLLESYNVSKGLLIGPETVI
jgi:hypothetical protein